MIETIFVLFVVGICILIIPASILVARLRYVILSKFIESLEENRHSDAADIDIKRRFARWLIALAGGIFSFCIVWLVLSRILVTEHKYLVPVFAIFAAISGVIWGYVFTAGWVAQQATNQSKQK